MKSDKGPKNVQGTTKIRVDAADPVARAQKAAKRVRDEGDLSQAEQFEKAARDLECDLDDEKFMGVLRNLANYKH